MSDVQNLVGRLRQIAESQWMDFDSPNVAATLDDAATTLEALASIGSVVAEEPEWAVDSIQYGHVLADGIFIVEHRGVNYSTHQRRIKLGQPESSWVPVTQEGATDA